MSCSVPGFCHPQTQQGSSGMEVSEEQKPGRSSSSLNMFGEEQWSSLSRVTAHGKSVSASSEPPTTCPQHRRGLLSQPLSLVLLHVCDWALPARDNSISVQQIQTLIEFSQLNQGRNSSASLQSWELFLKRIVELARKSNRTFLRVFKCVCAHVHTFVCLLLQARNNHSLCLRRAQVTLIVRLPRRLFCGKKKTKKIFNLCVYFCFSWLTAMEKTYIATSLLLALFHPRHHLSSCHSTAARAVVFSPLCSLIWVQSPEVIWNRAYPPLYSTRKDWFMMKSSD